MLAHGGKKSLFLFQSDIEQDLEDKEENSLEENSMEENQFLNPFLKTFRLQTFTAFLNCSAKCLKKKSAN